MARGDDEPRRIIHIGPGDDTPLDDQPSFLIEDARRRVQADDERRKEGVQVARRLVVAFIAVVLLAVVFHVIMPAFKMRLPPIVPVLSYVAIAAGAILSVRDSTPPA